MIRSDFTIRSGYFDYKIFYKGKQIVHVGSDGAKRRLHSNLKFYREQAEIELRNIMDGKSYPYIADAISKIDKGLKIKESLESYAKAELESYLIDTSRLIFNVYDYDDKITAYVEAVYNDERRAKYFLIPEIYYKETGKVLQAGIPMFIHKCI